VRQRLDRLLLCAVGLRLAVSPVDVPHLWRLSLEPRARLRDAAAATATAATATAAVIRRCCLLLLPCVRSLVLAGRCSTGGGRSPVCSSRGLCGQLARWRSSGRVVLLALALAMLLLLMLLLFPLLIASSPLRLLWPAPCLPRR
jgi:hypothetical protein